MPVDQATLSSRTSVAVTSGTAGPQDVTGACALAIEHACRGVIVNPCFASSAVRALHAAEVRCEVTVSFPLGCDLPAVKLYAAEQSVLSGCSSILLAVNAGLILAGDVKAVQRDLELMHASTTVPMSVFVNTADLSDKQLMQLVHAAVLSGAASVVCRGNETRAVTPSHVAALMAATDQLAHLRIAGPVDSIEQMLALLDAGADEIVLDLLQARRLLPGASQSQQS